MKCMLLIVFITCASFCGAQWKLETIEAGGKWSINLVKDDISKPIVTGLPKEHVPTPVQVLPDLYRIVVTCGNPCNYTSYAATDSGRIDGPFFLEMKLDTSTLNVFYVGKNGKFTKKRLFAQVKETSYDLPDLSPVAAVFSAVVDIDVLADGTTEVKYLKGPGYQEATIVLR